MMKESAEESCLFCDYWEAEWQYKKKALGTRYSVQRHVSVIQPDTVRSVLYQSARDLLMQSSWKSLLMITLFHQISTNLIICLFYYIQPSRCNVSSHCDFVCISLMTLVFNTFVYWPFACFLWKIIISNHFILIGLFLFSI